VITAFDANGDELASSNEVSARAFSSSDEILVELMPSRTSGAAPLYVHFDATGTAAASTTRPFHDLLYQWNFGDPGSGSWSTTDRSKNTGSGAVAGHVFESPGVYMVTLMVRDGAGATQETVQITVEDPDEFFSSAQNSSHETVVVSNTQGVVSGDWSGEPPGARRYRAISWSDAMSQRGPGHRILLRGGETWNAPSTTVLADDDAQIGMFGGGPRPVIRSSSHFVEIRGDRNTVMDLEVRPTGFQNGIRMDPMGRYRPLHSLCLRVDVINPHIGFDFYINDFISSTSAYNDLIAIVDCVSRDTDAGGYCIWYWSDRAFIAGSRFSGAGFHNMRTGFSRRTAISNCYFANPGNAQHSIKFTAPEIAANTIANGQTSQYNIISDCRVAAAPGDAIQLALESVNDEGNQRIQDLIFERNFTTSDNSGQTLRVSGYGITLRNNIFDISGDGFGHAVELHHRGGGPATRDMHVYNNIMFDSRGRNITGVSVQDGAVDSRIFNNIIHSAGSSGSRVVDDRSGVNTQWGNNLLAADSTANWFENGAPANATDFRPADWSEAVDAGTDTIPVFDDFDGNPRPTDGDDSGTSECDLGPFELQIDPS